ncbi:MAG: hypothetical protein P8010_24550 [Desulfosarcinaceae bacterium]|jgi:hypothetical protein
MQTRCCITLCLILCAAVCHGTIETAAAQPATREPIVSLTVSNVPLGEALDTLSRDTGYRFHLNPQWKAHPVSVNISKVPLEEALKRLLRNLNHSIVWESEDAIRIMVYSASEGAGSAHAVSFAAPPQEEVPEEIEPFDPADAEADFSTEDPNDNSDTDEAEIQTPEAPEETVSGEEAGRSDADPGDGLQEEAPPVDD